MVYFGSHNMGKHQGVLDYSANHPLSFCACQIYDNSLIRLILN